MLSPRGMKLKDHEPEVMKAIEKLMRESFICEIGHGMDSTMEFALMINTLQGRDS